MSKKAKDKVATKSSRNSDSMFKLNIVNVKTGASVYQVELTSRLRARVFGAIMKILTEDKGSMDLK